jgi:glycosyltransferase involved in cell wall biosynthesis
MRHCSIVIRCCNEERHIGRLLDGIFQQTVRNLEVIVVDSGSTDRTLEIVSRYPVRILNIRPDEFSFGLSLNRGCREATKEFIAIASAHVYPVYDTWIESLIAPFTDPQVALVYGKQRGNEISKYSERQIFSQWFPDDSDTNQLHPFCNNANSAIRRSLWEKMSYDEYLTGLEDIDWANRAIQSGYRLAYSADAEVIHAHDEPPSRIYNRYRREAITFKRIFPHERFHFGSFLGLFFSNVFSDYFHALNDGLFLRNLMSIPMFRLMQFWGTYRGFAQRGPVSSKLRDVFYYPRKFLRRRKEESSNGTGGKAINYDEKLVNGHSEDPLH